MVHTTANLIHMFENGQEQKAERTISNLIDEFEYFEIFGDDAIIVQE